MMVIKSHFYAIVTGDSWLNLAGFYNGPSRVVDNTPKLFNQRKFAEKIMCKLDLEKGCYAKIITVKVTDTTPISET
jgi:hypothetical protein